MLKSAKQSLQNLNAYYISAITLLYLYKDGFIYSNVCKAQTYIIIIIIVIIIIVIMIMDGLTDKRMNGWTDMYTVSWMDRWMDCRRVNC